MSDLVKQFLDGYRGHYAGVNAKTVEVLGEDDAFAITDIHDDFLTIQGEVLTAHPQEDIADSLLFAFFCSLPKKLYDLQHDFLCARYDEVRRELRFIWEMAFRARFIDVNQHGKSVDEKIDRLEAEGRSLNWNSVIRPILDELFELWPEKERRERFKDIWDRLNQVCHPTAGWLRDGIQKSNRLHVNSFDEWQARRTLADLCEIVALVWGMLLATFPEIGPHLAANGALFRHCPQFRLFLPPTDGSGSDLPDVTPITAPASPDDPQGGPFPSRFTTPAISAP